MASRSLGRILTETKDIVPHLRTLLSPAAIFLPPSDDNSNTTQRETIDLDRPELVSLEGMGVPPHLPPPPSAVGLKTKGELMCLDVGMQRTGVAVTEFSTGDVHALKILHHPSPRASGDQRMKALQRDITFLEQKITDHGVVGLVVGWPLEPKTGQPGAQCEQVQSFVVRLQQAALLMSMSADLLNADYGGISMQNHKDNSREPTPQFSEQDARGKTSSLASLNVFAWDERYSSKAVQSLARDRAQSLSRRSKKKRKRRRRNQPRSGERESYSHNRNEDDDLAAAYILSEVVETLFEDEDELWKKEMGF